MISKNLIREYLSILHSQEKISVKINRLNTNLISLRSNACIAMICSIIIYMFIKINEYGYTQMPYALLTILYICVTITLLYATGLAVQFKIILETVKYLSSLSEDERSIIMINNLKYRIKTIKEFGTDVRYTKQYRINWLNYQISERLRTCTASLFVILIFVLLFKQILLSDELVYISFSIIMIVLPVIVILYNIICYIFIIQSLRKVRNEE